MRMANPMERKFCMNVAEHPRSACAEFEGGCRKCQWLPQKRHDEKSHFLLAPQNAHARAALLQGLENAGAKWADWGAVLALPSQQPYLMDDTISLLDSLPEITRLDVKGTWYAGGLDMGLPLISALIQAEPLSTLLARAEHEWVREALSDDWLFNVFHPIVHSMTGEVFGHEALIRARHPQTGKTYGAGPIIEAANALGIDHILDQQARRTAIRQAAVLPMMEGRLFINFMPNTIYDPAICLRTTMEAAQENGMPLSRLVFEVVETEHIPDLKRLKMILDYYRERGVGTAVDDMGAGFSSLQYLTALRPDFVKLDRALVVQAEHDRSAREKLDVIVAQAKALGIQVIAEGIETKGQLALCQEAGADLLQGYLFGLPANPPMVSRSAFSEMAAAA